MSLDRTDPSSSAPFERITSKVKKPDRDILFRAIQISMHAVIICDLDLRIEWVNEEFLRKFGLEESDDAKGMSVRSLLDIPESIEEPVHELMKTGRWQGELRLRVSSDSVIDVLLTATILSDAAGAPLKIIASGIDITEEKQVENALHESEAQIRAFIKNARGFGVYRVELSDDEPYGTRIAFASPSIQEILGLENPEDSSSWFENIHPDDLERVTAAHHTSRMTGKSFDETFQSYHHKKQCWRWIRAISSPVMEPEGTFTQFNGMVIDITDMKRTEEALADKTMLLDSILYSASDVAIATTDLDLRITYYNPMAEKFFGYSADEVIGKTVMDMHLRENVDSERLDRAIEIVRTTGEYRYTLDQETENGPRYLESRVAGIFNSNGDLAGFSLFSRDITERKLAADTLQESRERYRNLVESTSDWVWAVDLDCRHVYSNDAVKQLLGYEVNDILNNSSFNMIHSDDQEATKAMVAGCVEQKKGWKNVDIRWLHKDGSIRFFESTAQPLFDTEGELAGFTGIDRDITDSKRVEEALRASTEMLNLVIDNIPQAVFWKDRNSVFLGCNKAFADTVGLENPEDIIGQNDFDLCVTKEEAHSYRDADKRIMDSDKPEMHIFEQLHNADGSRRWIDTNKTPIHDDIGEVIGILVTFEDITERKKAEEALLESENNLRALFNSMTDIVFEMDYDGRYINIAPTSPELMYGPSEELLGKTLHEVFSEPEADRFLAFIRESLDENKTIVIEYPLVIEERTIWFEGRANPVTQNTVLYIARNITERKHAEEERVRLISAIEQAAETIMITDVEANIEYVNPAFERITGYSRDEVMGMNPRILQSGEHDNSFFSEMWETLTQGETWSGQLINKKKDDSFYTEDVSISPVRNSSGQTVNYVAVKRDITQEIRLEDQLRQAQKMEAIGQLAGGVAHDFNNLLQAITGYTDLALNDIDDAHSARDFVKEVARAGERARALVSQLLSFSRQQIINPIDLDMNDLIEKLMKMIHRVIGEHIQCNFIAGHELGVIHADWGQMEQIIINLCVNARDAMPDGGNITIETGNVLIDSDYARIHPWSSPGHYILLCITDTGLGMDKNTVSSIFDPFFTTKEAGKGTGLGMSTVYGIVKQHKGDIQVYSEPCKGSIFKIYLPVVQRRAAQIPSSVEGSVPRGSETILIAEDDDMVRNLARQTLVKSGYTVLDAENGEEALKLFYHHADKIDLLFLDVVMPGLGGKEIYERVIETHPDMLMLFCSGYSHNAIHTGFIFDSDLHFIQKPCSPDALLRRIRKVLDS